MPVFQAFQISSIMSKSENEGINKAQDTHHISTTSSINNTIPNNKSRIPIEMQWRQFQVQQENNRKSRQTYNLCFEGARGGNASFFSRMINLFYNIGVYVFFCFQTNQHQWNIVTLAKETTNRDKQRSN